MPQRITSQQTPAPVAPGQTQSPPLRKPPRAGGPRRAPVQRATPRRKKSKLWKYLIPAVSTGGGIGLGLTNWFA